MLVLGVRRQPILPVRGERLRVLGLGALGYAFQSSLFYSALQRGSAAVVTLLFYAYPAFVTLVEAAASRRRPSPRLLSALGLSATGTLLIVMVGADVAISPAGVAFALAAAGAFAVYLLAGAAAAPRTVASSGGPVVIAAWVAGGAALSLTAVGLGSDSLRWPGEDWWLMATNGLATAAAFGLLFAALDRVGASRTAVVMTLEALSAVVLAALLLGESLVWIQLVGGLAVLAATLVISTSREPARALAPDRAAATP